MGLRKSVRRVTQGETLGYSLLLLGGAQIQNLMRQPTRADPRRQFQIPRKLILEKSRFCG
jgi:hypothetical protein